MSMNHLSSEPSPYLLQHKDNPIHWQAWSEAAFAQAARENKPVFLSVGYSTCHWCHVMAHESFEDQEVADQLNAHFVCIKVDREERPDVDQIYMSALQNLSGGGGWPMSLWLTADGKPFFAGTYFPKYRFLQLLRRIQEIWSQEPDKLMADAERLTSTVQRSTITEPREADAAEVEEFLKTYINKFQYHFDETNGGFGQAPKFPQTMNLMVMMRQDRATGLNQAEAMVTTTLNKMLRGGIYDHLRGGFHRYSVDEKWLVPHFEKMLYDQALLVLTLTEAYQLYGEAEFSRAARETCDFVLRELTHAGGGFYSALDADSLNPQTGEMEEGYFCTFDYAELRQHLTPEELSELERVYGVTPAGNFEGRSILNLQDGFEGSAKNAKIFAKLEEMRASRPLPHLDDKVIAAWNGWMIWALIKAGTAFSEPRYLTAAAKALSFIKDNLKNQEGHLLRFWRQGAGKARATSEDYASLILACVEMYQVDFDSQWADWALKLQDALDRDFWDGEDGTYFANDGKDLLLPLRPKDDYDGVSPCSNSMAALNLSRFYLLTGDVKYHHQAQRIAQSLFAKLEQYPSGLPFLALALDFDLAESKVVIFGSDKAGWPTELRQSLNLQFEPHLIFALAETAWPVTKGKGSNTNEPLVYTCLAERCLAPAKSRPEAEAQILSD